MRSFVTVTAGLALLAAAPLATAHDGDRPVTREEVRQKQQELRDLNREYKEGVRERRRAARKPRAWFGAQGGLAAGSIDTCPEQALGCDESGMFGMYSGNATLTGAGGGLRLRASRGVHKGDNRRMPYEQAVLPVFRLGYSDWYAGLGYGRIVHPHDDYDGDLKGVAYDVFWAPSSRGATGIEVSFHGLGGEDGAYGSVNVGLRFGKLR